MTGFSADVSHLTKILAKSILSHQVLFYQNPSIQKSVLNFSSVLQRAAQRDGGRPYGVQALLVGLDKGDFHLYTCDPTGRYHHYPKGQAIIGKHSEPIRKEITDNQYGTAEALDACLASIVKACTKENVKIDLDMFEAILLWESEDGECQAAEIDPEFVSHRCREIQKDDKL